MPRCQSATHQHTNVSGNQVVWKFFVHIGSQTTLDGIAQTISTIEQRLCLWRDADELQQHFTNHEMHVERNMKEIGPREVETSVTHLWSN